MCLGLACLASVCPELEYPAWVCLVSVYPELVCPVSVCPELVSLVSACPVWCPVELESYQVRWWLRDAWHVPSSGWGVLLWPLRLIPSPLPLMLPSPPGGPAAAAAAKAAAKAAKIGKLGSIRDYPMSCLLPPPHHRA